ncbi:MAG TPA: hypothetical protein VGC89_15705 [Pyrinomonadaceae bacterium]|jgi:hypothetical protein
MKTYRIKTFCKQLTCPSSETLLSYGVASLASELKTQVTKHLAGCDFCDAELHLLTRHQTPAPVNYEQPKMPAALRYLAESLLAGSLLRIESFAETIYDKERLTLTQ